MLNCRQFWGPEVPNYCTVVNFGGRKRERVVLSSILGAGGAKMLYCRQFGGWRRERVVLSSIWGLEARTCCILVNFGV